MYDLEEKSLKTLTPTYFTLTVKNGIKKHHSTLSLTGYGIDLTLHT